MLVVLVDLRADVSVGLAGALGLAAGGAGGADAAGAAPAPAESPRVEDWWLHLSPCLCRRLHCPANYYWAWLPATLVGWIVHRQDKRDWRWVQHDAQVDDQGQSEGRWINGSGKRLAALAASQAA